MITRRLAEAIAKVAGKPHVLDSTKEPTRGLFLAKFVPDAQLIRLVRDPRSAVASHYWRLKEKGFYHFLRRDWHAPRLAPAVPGRGRDELDRGQPAGGDRRAAGARVASCCCATRICATTRRPRCASIGARFGLDLEDSVAKARRRQPPGRAAHHRRQRRPARAGAALRPEARKHAAPAAALGRAGHGRLLLAADAPLRLFPAQAGQARGRGARHPRRIWSPDA